MLICVALDFMYTHCMQILNSAIGSAAPDVDQGHQALDSHTVRPQDFGKEKTECWQRGW